MDLPQIGAHCLQPKQLRRMTIRCCVVLDCANIFKKLNSSKQKLKFCWEITANPRNENRNVFRFCYKWRLKVNSDINWLFFLVRLLKNANIFRLKNVLVEDKVMSLFYGTSSWFFKPQTPFLLFCWCYKVGIPVISLFYEVKFLELIYS